MSIPIILREVTACRHCEASLPHGARPILQVHSKAKILIAGQAPGRKVHFTGIPFNDASGERLRDWLGIDKTVFYDASKIALLPMGFCYPGTGKSGDLPPRPECATIWRSRLMENLSEVELILPIGQYAQAWHLKGRTLVNLTETVKAWRQYWPHYLPLPHPSPRNNIWLKRHLWFNEEVLPTLKVRVKEVLDTK